MAKVSFDYSKAAKFISDSEITNIESIAANAKNTLVSKTGAGNDFLGWIDLPVDYDKEEFSRITWIPRRVCGLITRGHFKLTVFSR